MSVYSTERTGAAIRKLRTAKGWTLAQLSDACGVPLATLSRVELGQTPLNYDKLVRLCRALEVDLQGLVTRQADASTVPIGRRSVIRAGEGEAGAYGPHTARFAAAELRSCRTRR